MNIGVMTEIRAMQQKDLEEVSSLEQQIFSRPWSKRAYEDALHLDNTVFLVAEENGRVIGYLGMYISLDEGEITNVAVSERKRGRGVAAKLLDALKEEALRRNVAKLILEVRVSNVPAIHLYEKHGFQKCGVRKGFYEEPKEDAYIMIYGQ